VKNFGLNESDGVGEIGEVGEIGAVGAGEMRSAECGIGMDTTQGRNPSSLALRRDKGAKAQCASRPCREAGAPWMWRPLQRGRGRRKRSVPTCSHFSVMRVI